MRRAEHLIAISLYMLYPPICVCITVCMCVSPGLLFPYASLYACLSLSAHMEFEKLFGQVHSREVQCMSKKRCRAIALAPITTF